MSRYIVRSPEGNHLSGRTPAKYGGIVFAILVALLTFTESAQAYVGPGAGFAVVGSLGVIFVTFFLALVAILTWPFRAAWRFIRVRQLRKRTSTKRVIILGLDGMDPKLIRQWMAEGHMPHFKKLAETGTFSNLASTIPPISPVAWASFTTGVEPAGHNIFDFLNRDMKSGMPVLSSTDIRPPMKTMKLGRYEFPVSKPLIRLLRKSKPFWQILGEHYVPCHVIRVPITFPPEQLPNGAMLSAMCVPDLMGTQGSFSLFTSDKNRAAAFEGGMVFPVEVKDSGGEQEINTNIPGPPNPLTAEHEPMMIPLRITFSVDNGEATLHIDGKSYPAGMGSYTEWIHLKYSAALGQKVSGIARFRVMSFEPFFNLYMTPINMDPESPAMPISEPGFFAQYLARLNGPYATLGLAEDTWALNEGVTDEQAFLDFAAEIHEEREKMWFNSLDKNKTGVNTVVFDGTDRIQHMFFRHISDPHPANAGKDNETHKDAILDMYRKADDVLGRTMKYVDDKTVLISLSDHGFKPFKRGINLNSWLLKEGYLAAKNGHVGRYFDGIDWKNTRAYTFGLTGIYINVKGREGFGIVEPGEEFEALKKEISDKLTGMLDPESGATGILRVYDADEVYKGPYRHNAPDLLIGYNVEYRASWNGAVGIADDVIFDDNTKAWSGDHCMDPLVVPGYLLCNRKIETGFPSILDIAPTVLELFGVKKPRYMPGASLFDKTAFSKRASLADAYFLNGKPKILQDLPGGKAAGTEDKEVSQ
jgi:predicted AlkP superfamily phosphohydrolase/phosphomutase